MASSLPTIAAGGAGVLCHNLIFIRGEWHIHALPILQFHALTFTILTVSEAWYHNYEWLPALGASLILFGSYIACLFSSMTIYQLFFHPLRRFPGPVLARVSKLWHVFHCVNSRIYLLLDKLHLQYGEFVRTGESGFTLVISQLRRSVLD